MAPANAALLEESAAAAARDGTSKRTACAGSSRLQAVAGMPRSTEVAPPIEFQSTRSIESGRELEAGAVIAGVWQSAGLRRAPPRKGARKAAERSSPPPRWPLRWPARPPLRRSGLRLVSPLGWLWAPAVLQLKRMDPLPLSRTCDSRFSPCQTRGAPTPLSCIRARLPGTPSPDIASEQA